MTRQESSVDAKMEELIIEVNSILYHNVCKDREWVDQRTVELFKDFHTKEEVLSILE